MSQRIPVIFLVVVLVVTVACTNKRVNNPLANVGSKQPDKVLFDRAMDALKHNRYDVARLTLETLINTYPDSEYIARAKLGVADSWYAEGGTAALTQAEAQYKDFITFFPNMPEAAEAQLKIANIHYEQMEKPDRDFTHAMRAEEEYRNLILQFPDSKLVPEAKQRLLEVQEILAEREFRIGHFYYMREAYPAAIARLQSVTERYPLYSHADEALYLLGQSYEGEIGLIRTRPIQEDAKAKLMEQFTKGAVDAYDRILTRYPLMDRAEDAKVRLQALHQTVPHPTVAAVEQNKAEEQSRKETSMFGHLMGNFKKHPDVEEATKVGDPTLVDPKPVSATDVVRAATSAMRGGGGTGNNSVAVEAIGTGAPPQGQAAPRSDAPPETAPAPTENTTPAPADNSAAPAAGELKPNVADPNELKPNVQDSSLPPPPQVNELQTGDQGANPPQTTTGKPGTDAKAANAGDQPANDAMISSSKPKKKKGLKKIIPF